HHGGRPHDREPDRPVGGRGDGVRPQRAWFLPGAGRAEQGLRRRPGDQPGPGGALRGGQHPRRHRLRPPRPAGRDRESSPVSIPVGSALPTGAVPEEPGPDTVATPGDPRPVKTRLLPRLGVGGWISVAIIAVAVLLAIFGPLVRPYDPNEVTLSY